MNELCSEMADIVKRESRHSSRLLEDLDPRWLEEGSDRHAAWKGMDLGAMLLSFRPFDRDGIMNGLILFRRFGRPPFDRQDLGIVHVILAGVKWLHADASLTQLDATVFDLSPRLNAVLNLLLQGLARKQVAAKLGITINTTGGYVKEIYQRFGVHSQAELIRQMVDGGSA